MNAISIHADYRLALAEIKQRIQTTQTRAVLAANYELLSLYWYIGQKIVKNNWDSHSFTVVHYPKT